MNLRWVHAVLIMCSAALAVLFGIWCLSAYSREHAAGSLVAAIVSFGVGKAFEPGSFWKKSGLGPDEGLLVMAELVTHGGLSSGLGRCG